MIRAWSSGLQTVVVLALLGAFFSGGCIGRAGPAGRYLRLIAAECAPVSGGTPLTLRDLDALPNLDRPAVLTADGQIITASQELYWEGAPDRIVTRAISSALACRGLDVSRPRAGKRDGWNMSGHLLSFEVQRRSGNRFEIAVELILALPGTIREERRFMASEPMDGLDARETARAAQTAMDRLTAEIAAWSTRMIGK